MLKTNYIKVIVTLAGWLLAGAGLAQTSGNAQTRAVPLLTTPLQSAPALVASPQYVLRQGDVVEVRIYQEDDMTYSSRIGRDGTITLPLLGSVKVVSNSVEAAMVMIRDLLAKDYLVNPQVTLNITEYAKRRFTVLGQVQHAGSYEMPGDDSVTLLQAIAAAGGYTRIGNPRKITVQRTVGTQNKFLQLDAEAMAQDRTQKPFVILPDDVIVVGEKWL
jgi:protein involved in polysaccharide export with SLBB domain